MENPHSQTATLRQPGYLIVVILILLVQGGWSASDIHAVVSLLLQLTTAR